MTAHHLTRGKPLSLLRRLADESPLVYALVVATGAAVGLGETWQKVVLAALALVFGLVVRSTTTSPSTLVDTVETATQKTAAQLTTTTVGKAGEVSEAGGNVAVGVANEVVSAVGGLAGKLAGGER